MRHFNFYINNEKFNLHKPSYNSYLNMTSSRESGIEDDS